jgi:hypothetical protein
MVELFSSSKDELMLALDMVRAYHFPIQNYPFKMVPLIEFDEEKKLYHAKVECIIGEDLCK